LLGTERSERQRSTLIAACRKGLLFGSQISSIDSSLTPGGIGLGIVSLGARAYVFWRYHAPANRLHPVIN